MYEIIQNCFNQNCEDYLVTESEADDIAKELSGLLDDDFLKDMYQSEDRESFIQKELQPLFEVRINRREQIKLPTETQMRDMLKTKLQGVVFIH